MEQLAQLVHMARQAVYQTVMKLSLVPHVLPVTKVATHAGGLQTTSAFLALVIEPTTTNHISALRYAATGVTKVTFSAMMATLRLEMDATNRAT